MQREKLNRETIRQEALRLGFAACGIAKAEPVDKAVADGYRQWIACGGHADMRYLTENVEKRLDPTLLLPGAKSIVVVALNYTPARRMSDSEYQIAAYALGRDYHDLLKERLRQLLQAIIPQHDVAPNEAPSDAVSSNETSSHTVSSDATEKLCVDTVPILERYWAQQAGIGFIGRNHQLIIPSPSQGGAWGGPGSMFFLGEIVSTLEADSYDSPMESSLCGNCHRCIDACPTGALRLPSPPRGGAGGGQVLFDSRRCLSYQTIENRGDLDPAAAQHLGTSIYGCDRCQQACPFMQHAQPTTERDLQPTDDLLRMTRDDWHSLTPERYRQLFKGSAVKRAKYEGLMRNIAAAKGNG